MRRQCLHTPSVKQWAIEKGRAHDYSLGAAQDGEPRYLLRLLMAPQPTNALRASSSLCGGMHQTGATGCAGRLPKQIKSGYPHGFKPKTEEKHKQARAPKSSPKKAAKPEPKKSQAGLSTNVNSLNGAVFGPFPSSSPTKTTPKQQAGELRRQNQIPARKTRKLEVKQPRWSETEQGADVEDGDDGSSVTSCFTRVSRQGADTVVGSVSTARHSGCLESLERETEQLEERVAALPNQIISAVRECFQNMFMTVLTQALSEIVTQICESVLEAVRPSISTQIKTTPEYEPPPLKRKTASRQADKESFSVLAHGVPVRFLP
ncbi:hypothetical protein HPB51_017345 [Rhipicephalus microplus]|uniref:Uncharacterized protein n=1 Tax=Rhipicephalus microplus TaxID=6941 RepID=A0A9J6EI16_RHIMP|nr:hypothetical protein HPB51_017345 [Rhipicephalus microplus]